MEAGDCRSWQPRRPGETLPLLFRSVVVFEKEGCVGKMRKDTYRERIQFCDYFTTRYRTACTAQAVECIRNVGVGKSKQTSHFWTLACSHVEANLEVELNSKVLSLAANALDNRNNHYAPTFCL